MKAICLISTFALTFGLATAAEAQYPIPGQAYTVTQQPLYSTPVRGSYYQQASYTRPVSYTVRYAQPVNAQPVTFTQPAEQYAGGTVAYQPAAGCDPCASSCCSTAAYQPVGDDGYYVGRGLLGGPKLYARGQPIRNFIRWLGP